MQPTFQTPALSVPQHLPHLPPMFYIGTSQNIYARLHFCSLLLHRKVFQSNEISILPFCFTQSQEASVRIGINTKVNIQGTSNTEKGIAATPFKVWVFLTNILKHACFTYFNFFYLVSDGKSRDIW